VPKNTTLRNLWWCQVCYFVETGIGLAIRRFTQDIIQQSIRNPIFGHTSNHLIELGDQLMVGKHGFKEKTTCNDFICLSETSVTIRYDGLYTDRTPQIPNIHSIAHCEFEYQFRRVKCDWSVYASWGVVEKESYGAFLADLTEIYWHKGLHSPKSINCTSQKPWVDSTLNSMGSTR